MRIALLLVTALFFQLSLAQGDRAALSDQVTSKEEGTMEGVLVIAKRAGSTITVTVVSDAQGRYRFPAARLAPGKYNLTIRAAGFDLEKITAEVTAQKTATVDLQLVRTKDLAAQLSNGEWMMSAPGDD